MNKTLKSNKAKTIVHVLLGLAGLSTTMCAVPAAPPAATQSISTCITPSIPYKSVDGEVRREVEIVYQTSSQTAVCRQVIKFSIATVTRNLSSYLRSPDAAAGSLNGWQPVFALVPDTSANAWKFLYATTPPQSGAEITQVEWNTRVVSPTATYTSTHSDVLQVTRAQPLLVSNSLTETLGGVLGDIDALNNFQDGMILLTRSTGPSPEVMLLTIDPQKYYPEYEGDVVDEAPTSLRQVWNRMCAPLPRSYWSAQCRRWSRGIW